MIPAGFKVGLNTIALLDGVKCSWENIWKFDIYPTAGLKERIEKICKLKMWWMPALALGIRYKCIYVKLPCSLIQNRVFRKFTWQWILFSLCKFLSEQKLLRTGLIGDTYCRCICLFIMINVYSVLVAAANNKRALYSLLLENQVWGPKLLCIHWIRHVDSFFWRKYFFWRWSC